MRIGNAFPEFLGVLLAETDATTHFNMHPKTTRATLSESAALAPCLLGQRAHAMNKPGRRPPAAHVRTHAAERMNTSTAERHLHAQPSVFSSSRHTHTHLESLLFSRKEESKANFLPEQIPHIGRRSRLRQVRHRCRPRTTATVPRPRSHPRPRESTSQENAPRKLGRSLGRQVLLLLLNAARRGRRGGRPGRDRVRRQRGSHEAEPPPAPLDRHARLTPPHGYKQEQAAGQRQADFLRHVFCLSVVSRAARALRRVGARLFADIPAKVSMSVLRISTPSSRSFVPLDVAISDFRFRD